MARDILFYGKHWLAKNRAYYDKKWVDQHLNSYLIAHKNEWAYCPKCKMEWNTKYVSPFFGIFINQPARHLVKTNVEDKEKRPDKLCPFHGECTMNGRRMGQIRRLNKRRLDKINKTGCIFCPSCKSWRLERMGQNHSLWKCRSCNSFVVIEKGYLNVVTGETEVVRMSYRVDLEAKETNNLFSKVVKIILSPGVKIRERI